MLLGVKKKTVTRRPEVQTLSGVYADPSSDTQGPGEEPRTAAGSFHLEVKIIVWKYFKSEIQALFKWFPFIDFLLYSKLKTKNDQIKDREAKETKKSYFLFTYGLRNLQINYRKQY